MTTDSLSLLKQESYRSNFLTILATYLPKTVGDLQLLA